MAARVAVLRNWEGTVVTRPRVIVRPKRVEDIQTILENSKAFPSPVRAIGANYSQTRCGVADGGTIVEMAAMNRILEITDRHVRVQAGTPLIDVATALEQQGLQLPVNPDLGNLTMGAAALAPNKDSSMAGEIGQLSSALKEVKLVLPNGKSVTVNESQADLLKLMRSSYGLTGIAHELTFRVVPLRAVRLDYESYSLEAFTREFPALSAMDAGLKFYLMPFRDRVTVEFRSYDEEAPTSRSGIWSIRKSVMTNVLPAFGSTVSNAVPFPPVRYFLIEHFNTVMRSTLDRAARNVTVFPVEWVRKLPKDAGRTRFTYSTWAFPQQTYPELLADYFEFCRDYYKRQRYRANLLHLGHRLHRDTGSLLSPSFAAPMITLDPSSTGDAGWEDFVIEFNDFCSQRRGIPLLNQTRSLTREQTCQAFGERWKLFNGFRKRLDPDDRMLNVYFAQLL
ncbi:MAG TPA: FAD-binding protein [Steroidobacteraceae bacterium]|jgi:FAD/FMN-containing dehydrogenase|nr:FAD-binding protein [Steroidobacteraceae bacterium]